MSEKFSCGEASNEFRLNKREFLKGLGFATLGGAFATPSFGAPSRGLQQKHWAWMGVGRRTSDDDWKRRFAEMRSLGFHAAVTEVYNGNHAFFEHPHPDVETVAPVLERIVPLAKEEGIEVHAWMWTMPCNNRKIVEKHPDWYAVNGRGESACDKPAYVGYYRFLCSRHPEVQDFVATTARALADIDGLAGVHLDYVRLPDVILAKGLWKKYDIVQDREYPQYDYCYCDRCRRLFQEESGIDPLNDLDDPSQNDVWRQFRYDGITNLVNGRLVPTVHERGKQITAAVFPNWEMVRQQWHRWNLDGFLPMLYHSFYLEDVPWIGQQVAAAKQRIRTGNADPDVPVYAGLFLGALSGEEFAKAIDVAKANGGSGISVFSYPGLRERHKEILRERLAEPS